ncbi:MAG: hypothetical protein IJH90_01045 [Mogibacterium sp.]|nr:hypothetical protein [Mogibacterium sp.]
MATVEELINQYENDPELRKEIEEILADGKVTFMEFMGFVKSHDVNVSIAELPQYLEKAKELGLLK